MLDEILLEVEDKMDKSLESLRKNLLTIRTGRANPAMLNHVQCEYYGSMTPINQMASISVVEGRQLVIKPYDRSIVKAMVQALNAANLGFPVQNEGDLIRIVIPPLTQDLRKSLSKDAQKMGENAKVVIRNIRREGNDQIKKDKSMPEDTKKDGNNEIQKLTDEYIKKIDAMVKEKTNDIMEI